MLPRLETPPDQFRYTFPEDGHTVRCYSKEGWFSEIRQHYVRNGYPIPPDWKEIAENQLCQLLPHSWCEYVDGGTPVSFVDTRFKLEDFIHGTTVLGSWKLSGDPPVDAKLAESRALTCSRCYLNVSIPGCGACHQVANYVAEASGGKTTKSDAALRACGVCHCSNAAAVHVPIQHLEKGISDVQMEQFRRVPWCWRWQEIDARRNEPACKNENAAA